MAARKQLLNVVGKGANTIRMDVVPASNRYYVSDTISRCSLPSTKHAQGFTNEVRRQADIPNICLSPSASETTCLNSVPGPRSYPLIGTLWQYLPGGPLYGLSWYDKLSELQKIYGDVVHEEIQPGMHIVHLYNPYHFGNLYSNEGKYPIRDSMRMLRRFNEKYNEGVQGILTSSGENWYKSRSAIQYKMSKPTAVRSFNTVHNKVADDFIVLLRHIRDADCIVKDIIPELYRFSTESVGAVCFDRRLGVLGLDNNPECVAHQFIMSVKEVLTASQSEMGSLPLYMLYDTPMFKKLVRAQKYINRVSKQFSKETMESTKNTLSGESIMPYLLTKTSLSQREALTLIGEFFFAGVDTTSHLIGFVLYNLCRNPAKMALLTDEIDETIGQSENISSAHLDKLSYLKAVVKETLRVTPVSPGNLRTLASDTSFGGYGVPSGTSVVLHNDWAGKQEIYVPKSDEFLPERWLRDGEYAPLNPFIVLSFGFGPRSCPGRRLAEQETFLSIVKILQNFNIKYCHTEDMKYEMQIINTPVTPLTFQFKDRMI